MKEESENNKNISKKEISKEAKKQEETNSENKKSSEKKENSKEKSEEEKNLSKEETSEEEKNEKEISHEETKEPASFPRLPFSERLKPLEIPRSSLEKTLFQEQPSRNLEQTVPTSNQKESDEEDEIKYRDVKKYETNKNYETSQNQSNVSQNINPLVTTPKKFNFERDTKKNNFQTSNFLKAPEIQDHSISEDYVVKPVFENTSKKDIRDQTQDFNFEKTDKGYEIKR
jgi:hypothetical protein